MLENLDERQDSRALLPNGSYRDLHIAVESHYCPEG